MKTDLMMYADKYCAQMPSKPAPEYPPQKRDFGLVIEWINRYCQYKGVPLGEFYSAQTLKAKDLREAVGRHLMGAGHDAEFVKCALMIMPPQPSPTARQMIAQTCANYGFSVEEVLGYSRQLKYLPCRIEIAKALHKRGLSSAQIGKFMNRDHTTVLVYLDRERMLAKKRAAYQKRKAKDERN